MGDGDERHVRLLAKREAQAKRPVSGQVADEKIGQRLAVVLRLLVLGLECGNMVPVLVIFAVLVDANTIDDGFAVFRFVGFRDLVLGPNEAALDAGFPGMGPVKSPFFVELLKWKTELAGLLYRLGEDMSRPVMPYEREQDVLYKPTQLLALMIQEAGYHGCIYPSAMGSGRNFVLFDTKAADMVSVEYFRVRRAAFFSSALSDYESVYDEGPYDHALPGG